MLTCACDGQQGDEEGEEGGVSGTRGWFDGDEEEAHPNKNKACSKPEAVCAALTGTQHVHPGTAA